MSVVRVISLLCFHALLAPALRYHPEHERYNLNENKTATEPKHYAGMWSQDNHAFHPSPTNWRFPFYVLTIDRYVDGDPTNNNANDTVFEHDWMSNQFRFGGDTAGILSDLDYIEGLGIKAIYFTGSMMINMPWSPDGFGPLDFTLLDRHHGDIDEWRGLIGEIHRRDMYVVFDNTMATMGNLLGYGDGLTNSTVTFNWDEYDYIWKDAERRYHDFQPSNERNLSCQYPRIWEQDGFLLPQDVASLQHGCRASEFDMYGDIKGTGAYPSYINQLSRFASVQDRLREWNPDVLEKIKVMSCLQITMLDIDGFRMDKAVQTTIDALAEWSTYQRECARRVGKDNFLVVGEVVADPKLANVYVGRGKQPNQVLPDSSLAVATNNETVDDLYIRPFGMTALDGIAFHYDVYGSLTRFLGLDGPWGSLGVDWVQIWNDRILASQDMVNANTGLFDPRHMFGTTNQDVFRWPALANGTQRQLLGLFVTILELPGIPMVYFGEEQGSYTLENLAPDYVYGRTPLASSRSSQIHGCYNLGEEVYVDMPFNSSGYGCLDDSVSLDHRDPSHPLRNILKRMFELRRRYPVLNDGFNLTTLSTRLHDIYLRGSQDMPSPTGLWSVHRGRNEQVQDFSGTANGNQAVWLVFHNQNETVTYDFNCSSSNTTGTDGPLLSSFNSTTVAKNLFWPYEEYDLRPSPVSYGFENSSAPNGCLSRITLRPWEFKAFVPKSAWEEPTPVITHVMPGHDERLLATAMYNKTQRVPITIEFSSEMNCNSIADNLEIRSKTHSGVVARLDRESVKCSSHHGDESIFVGNVASTFLFTGQLDDVAHGVHTYTIKNTSSADGLRFTNTRDKFMFRIGHEDNPMVFPLSSNYTSGILRRDPSSDTLYVSPRASGADKYQYSTNWGTTYSEWLNYTDGKVSIQRQPWSGTRDQEWTGEHVILRYWSQMTGSSEHVQHSDLDWDGRPPRRWPHAFVEGEWNQWGYDAGVTNRMSQDEAGNWTFDLFTSWPTNVMVNVWGMNPDGQPDKSAAFGDIDRDFVLDWLPPDSIANNVINISTRPSGWHLGYRIVVNDGNYTFALIPTGSVVAQAVVLLLICTMPVVTAAACVLLFIRFFYKVKFNKFGIRRERRPTLALLTGVFSKRRRTVTVVKPRQASTVVHERNDAVQDSAVAANAQENFVPQRSVLIATMEYDIPDWKIKIKIGGLGVMASLMSNNLRHQKITWVVPCLGDVEYPFHQARLSDSIAVTILEKRHLVTVHHHVVQNVTYVILDAPIFRKRSKAEPYPPRMDDLESGVYYSAWNQCIAAAIDRFQPDIYHINDYHGAAAPLYLLPETIPCCLSLHNAEFQGLWWLKSEAEMRQTCRVFNLREDVVKKYVQFGEIFNLLHAGASYLRIHQAGFGAVGVSSKYSQRSNIRYPIFWGLSKIGSLPNPDPTDTAPLSKVPLSSSVEIDGEWEQQRAIDRRQAQGWAGLNVDDNADLFIFVGRWSQQKGIDLIADVFFSVLEKYSTAQLICIGPVIDLHGKFAALKLSKLMEQYPGRVFSKPEFTTLPSYIFSGAEFALMPSRDEPFGLVAVEFGRKGALCVGSRVGGFGHMPGWWFTVESVTSTHLLGQFKAAISEALASSRETRVMMRAHSRSQRFPVAQWVEDLETLQTTSIEMSAKVKSRPRTLSRIESVARSRSRNSFARSASAAHSLKSEAGSPMATPVGGRSAQTSRTPSTADIRMLYNHHAPPRTNTVTGLTALPACHYTSGKGTDHSGSVGPSSPTPPDFDSLPPSRRLSVSSIVRDTTESLTVDISSPSFQDDRNVFYDKFSEQLDKKLNAKSSISDLCIETYLQSSEKQWFDKFHAASLRTQSSSTSLLDSLQKFTFSWKDTEKNGIVSKVHSLSEYDQYLGKSYAAPTGARKLLQRKVGSWQTYCVLLAFGQIVSANSYQLTLLNGQVGQSADKLYVLSAIYLACSGIWWLLYRRLKAVYVLSTPFLFFGIAFLLLAATGAVHDSDSVGRLQDAAAAVYSAGSSAAFLFFSLNFGTESGTPSQTWAFRAWVIAGTQQLLIAFLWYWGSYLVRAGAPTSHKLVSSPHVLVAVAVPLAVLMWAVGALLFFGLPDYYRQVPGVIPSFYRSLCKRGIVLWFWIMIVLQGYWLSTNYNRNWMFLWSAGHAPRWAMSLLVLFFFVGVWSTMLAILAILSKKHSWIIPIFAIGLGAPRWCQYLWSMSGIGYHVPWISNPAIGDLLSRAVWSWLGVLDAVQGVGFGMILLMTMTRIHITFTLTIAQMTGALITVLARLSAPNNVGPGAVFINLASDSLASVWFWVALFCQVIICVGWFKFFRKSQLQKP